MSALQRRILVVASVGIVALILALVLGPSARETIVTPLLYVIWALGGLIGSFPQAIFWAIFLTVALLVALRSFHAPWRPRELGALGISDKSAGRVESLSRWVHEAGYGDYFRQRLARHLLDLTLQATGHREPLSLHAIQALLATGRLRLPAGARAYLESGLGPRDHRSWGIFERLRLRVQETLLPDWGDAPDDPHLIELIHYLEEELEIGYDHRDF